MRGLKIWIGATVCIGYFAAARVVGNLYPVSTFDMYAVEHTAAASRIIARASDGSAHEIDTLDEWQCDRPPPLGRDACRDHAAFSYTIYLDREAADWIETHAASGLDGAQRVTVVRRIFRLHGSGGPSIDDCELAQCRARRRP